MPTIAKKDSDNYILDYADVFIRQTLKNWAASKQPPVHGRARLLLFAKSWSSIEQSEVAQPIFQVALNLYKHLAHRSTILSTPERFVEPINQNRLWLLHISPFLLSNLA